MKILIVTALKGEHEVILDHFHQKEGEKYDKELLLKVYNEVNGEFNDIQLLNLDGVGNVLAGINVTKAILEYKPDVIILTGIIGGFKNHSKVRLGDIILADKVVYYEYAKIKEQKIIRRFDEIGIPKELIKSIGICFDNWDKKIKFNPPDPTFEFRPTFHIGGILSGEKIIADDAFRKELEKQTIPVLGTEMESYGVLLANKVLNSSIPSIILKVVSDWADNNKNDIWHEYSFNVSASSIMYFLQSYNFKGLKELKGN